MNFQNPQNPKGFEKELSDWLLSVLGESNWQPGDSQNDMGYIRNEIADKIFAQIDSGQITNMDQLKGFIKDHIMPMLGQNFYANDPEARSILKSKGPEAAQEYLKGLYEKLGLNPDDAPKPDPNLMTLQLQSPLMTTLQDSSTLKGFEKDLSDWLLTIMGEGQWQPGDDPSQQGYIRSKIADILFGKIDSGQITNMSDLKNFIQNDPDMKELLSKDIYSQDPYLAGLVKNDPNAAYIYVKDLYSHLGLDPSTAPKPDGPPPPPTGDFEVVDYNIRTSDASWGPDTGSRNWANRQDAIVNQITAHGFPSVINLQESTDLQLYGGKGANGDDEKGGIIGRLNAQLRASGDTQDTYKVLNSNDGEDPIIYLSGPKGVTPVAGSETYVPLASGDQFGQRYMHAAAFTKTYPDGTTKNVVIGNAHAQTNDVGGLTDEDAQKISATLSAMEQSYNAKAILTMDSNSYLANHHFDHIGDLGLGFDPSQEENTSHLWGGGGKVEDGEWSNLDGSLYAADRNDPAAIAASDHVCLYGNYDLRG